MFQLVHTLAEVLTAAGISTNEIAVAPQSEVPIGVVFAPESAGLVTGTLQLISDAATAAVLTVSLDGMGTEAPMPTLMAAIVIVIMSSGMPTSPITPSTTAAARAMALSLSAIRLGTNSGASSVPMADAIDDLHSAPGGATPISAIDARQNAFADENRPEANEEAIEASNIDEERARQQAVAKLRTSARQFLTAEITTVGFTRLRPGIHVDLSGLYAPFDGIYYVTKTVHAIKADGYITKTSLRRPGMLDPADYPDGGIS